MATLGSNTSFRAKVTVKVSDTGALSSTSTPVTLKNAVAPDRLDRLTDVNATNEVNGAVPVYQSNTDSYVVRRLGIDDLSSAIDFSNAATDSVLSYNLSTNTYSNKQLTSNVQQINVAANNTTFVLSFPNTIVANTANLETLNVGVINRDPNINIVLTGDVIGNATGTLSNLLDATITVNTTIVSNGVELGVDTTGQYVANVANGTGVYISNTGGEGSVPVFSIGQDVQTNSAVTFNTANITTQFAVGSNVVANTTAIAIGNSTVNVTANSTLISTSTNTGGPGTGILLNQMNMFAFANTGENAGNPTFRNALPNSQTVLRVLPNGSVNAAQYTTQAQFEFFAVDYFSNTTNWHNLRILAQNDRFVIDTARGANTDAPRPIIFDIGGTGSSNATNANFPAVLALSANGRVGVRTSTPDAALTVNGTINATSDVWIGGNLTVTGTMTYINTTQVNVGDNIITLNADVTGAPTQDVGFEVNRGTSANVSMLWNESNARWTFGNTYITSGNANTSLLVGNSSQFTTITGNTVTTTNLNISNVSVSSALTANQINITGPNGIGATLTSPANDITTWAFTGKTFSVAGNESAPTGIFFKPDGAKMYIIGSTGDDINEYDLSTPWDIATAVFLRVSANIVEATAQDIFFRPDGTKLYLIGDTNDAIREYDLSTAWDVSTITFVQAFSVATQDTAAQGLFFRPDGLKLYITGASSDSVHEYNLATAWNISTATFLQTLSLASQETGPSGVVFNTTGTKMFVVGVSGDDINEYTLSTAWNISTATFVGKVFVAFGELTPNGIFYSEEQNKVWVVGSSGDAVDEYSTNTAGLSLVSNGGIYVRGSTTFANNVYIDGELRSYSNVEFQGSTTLSTTSIGGTLTATSTLTLGGSTTSTTSLGTTATTGTTIIGGATQTGLITVGQSTVTSNVNIATGATNATATKVVNMGTGGVSGSITNIQIGSNTAGALGNVNIWSNNLFVGANVNISPSSVVIGNTTVNATYSATLLQIANSTVTSNLTSSSLNIGANVTISTSQLSVGNTIANSTANSILVRVANATASANLTPIGLVTGITTVNATNIAIGANVYANATSIYVGNATTQSIITNNGIVVGQSTTGQVTLGGDPSGAIELGQIGRTTSGSPYIDFHSSINSPDFDVRIIATGGNTTVGSGNLQIISNTVNLPNTVITGTISGVTTLSAGNTTVTGFINVSSTANIGGAINARGSVTVNGALIVSNTASLGNTTITGFANVSSTLNVVGDVTVNGALTVSNTAAFGNTTITGTLSAGNTTITGTANVSANLTANNIRTTGSVQIDGDLTVSGNTVTINVTDLSLTDNMIYLNEPEVDTITGATSNGTAFIYTSNNTLSSGMVVTIIGITPSGYNVSGNTVTFANSTAFAVANTTSPGAYVSGGTAFGRAAVNPDLGWSGGYDDGTYRHAGMFRDATDGVFKVFDQYQPEPTGAFIDTSNNTFRIADFQSNNTVLGTANVAGTARVGTGLANHLQIVGAASAGIPTISAQGTDSSIDIAYATKSGASHFFRTNSTVTQFAVTHTASAVNYIQATGAATGGAPTISSQGSDATVPLSIIAKGPGIVYIGSTSSTTASTIRMSPSGGNALWVGASNTTVNYLQVTAGVSGFGPAIIARGTDTNVGLTFGTLNDGNIDFFASGDPNAGTGRLQLRVAPTTSAVNFVQVTGAATTGAPTISFQGSDTNISGVYLSKGTGVHAFRTGTNWEAFRIAAVNNSVNYLQVQGAVTGSTPVFSAQGSDTNISVQLSGKGTGQVQGVNPTNSIVSSVGQSGFGAFLAQGTTASYYFGYVGSAEVGRLTFTSSNNITFGTSSSATDQFRVSHTASAVNYLEVTGAVTGSGPTLRAIGSDANVALNIAAKASANVNINSNTNFAANTLTFTGSSGSNTSIALRVLSDGVLSFEGGAGQLFSIANNLTGQIFAVNDISGIPSMEVYSNGQVNVARFGGNVSIGTSTSTITVNGSVTFANAVSLANNLTVTGFANIGTTASVGANVVANTTSLFIGNSSVNTVITQTTASFGANSTATALFVAANGNIGIGNSTPTWRLHVGTDARVEGRVSVGGVGKFSVDAQNVTDGRLVITTDNTNGSPNANVGISNTAPVHKLSVNGNTFIGSSLNVATTFASGNATVTGFANVTGTLAVGGNTSLGNTTITGNLTVTGTTTYVNTTTLNIGDNIITLNADVSGSPTESSGIEINRGTSANTYLFWNEASTRWEANTGNSSSAEFRIVSNTYARAMSMTAGGLLDSWGDTANVGAYATFNVASGVNKFRTNNRDYIIANTASDLVTFAANGNVGVGNTAPFEKLIIEGTAARIQADDASTKLTIVNRGNNTVGRFPQLVVQHHSGNTAGGDSGGQPVIELIHLRGNTSGTQAIVSGDILGGYNTWGSNATNILSGTRIQGIAEANFTTTATAGLQFFTTNAGTQTEVVRMSANGNVGIGNTAPNTSLSVNGGVRALGGAPGAFNANNKGYSFAGVGDSDGGMFSTADNTLNFYTNAAERVTIAGANVGIGNTAPTDRLRVEGTISHLGLAPSTGTNVDQIYTATPSITLNTTWQSTGVTATNLANGTYVVQLFANDVAAGGTANNEYYSGIMSWYSADVNSTVIDEVPLHRAGVSGSNNSIFLATQRTATANTSDLILMMSSAANNSSSSTYTIKFRRMI